MEKDTLIRLRTNGLDRAPAETVATKEAERQRLAHQVEAYLARGGTIEEVDHTANRAAPYMAYNNQTLADTIRRNHARKAGSKRGRQTRRNDLTFGAQPCTRTNAS